MKIKTFMKLPLSERLQRSLDDLIYCEKNPKFRINMCDWFEKGEDEDGKYCAVCHAGACLAVSINGPVTRGYDSLSPAWFADRDYLGGDFSDFMQGVNSLRVGHWNDAAEALGLKPRFFRGIGIRWGCMPDYHETPGQYKKAFRKIIRFVKKKEKEYAKKGKSMFVTASNQL